MGMTHARAYRHIADRFHESFFVLAQSERIRWLVHQYLSA